jgi:hypothetical protein
MGHILQHMEKALYFFEPGGDASLAPLEVYIPSLSTLSPSEDRIKEYQKRFCSFAYFWPWSYWEMWSVICDSNIGIDMDEFDKRHIKFGGILRHVLNENPKADVLLVGRVREVSVDVLTSIALNVDQLHRGNNVSGFLVCYDNRLVEQNRFSTKNLEDTSLLVEEAVASRLHIKPLREKMQVVLDRLNGEKLDISGKVLESVAMELLSKGRDYAWVSC